MESQTGGSGEVHAHISAQPDKGEGMSGKFDDVPSGGARGGSARDFSRKMRDRADDAIGSARERGADMRDRLGEAARRTRGRADHLLDETEDTLEQRTGLVSSARESPLAALGIAFAIGFLLAGDGDEPEKHPSVAKAKNQIKGAIMGGFSAAISQQLRSFIEDQGGVGTLLAALGVPVPGVRDQPFFTPDDEFRDA
jgi:ElaB/YqjD/DUF883 family membrane-anchored ribosome-binding protein